MTKVKSHSELPGQTSPDGQYAHSLTTAARQALSSWACGMIGFIDEVGKFARARLHENMNSWTQISNCRDMTEALRHQQQYVIKAAADYFDVADRLSRLSMDIANQNVSVFGAGSGLTIVSPQPAPIDAA